MSELQAILARRRRLNQEESFHDEDDERPAAAAADAIASQSSSTPQLDSVDDSDFIEDAPSPPTAATAALTPPRIADDLQAKLRERRMKAANVYKQHVKNDLQSSHHHDNDETVEHNIDTAAAAPSLHSNNYNNYNNNYTVRRNNDNVVSMARKSSFFPRSSPVTMAPPVWKEQIGGEQLTLLAAQQQQPPAANVWKDSARNDTQHSNLNQGTVDTLYQYSNSVNNNNNIKPTPPQTQKQETTSPKSPSMLDLMAERYKQQKLLKEQNELREKNRQQQLLSSSSSVQQEEETVEKAKHTLYRSSGVMSSSSGNAAAAASPYSPKLYQQSKKSDIVTEQQQQQQHSVIPPSSTAHRAPYSFNTARNTSNKDVVPASSTEVSSNTRGEEPEEVANVVKKVHNHHEQPIIIASSRVKAVPSTPPRIANDLQAKLMERRMKADGIIIGGTTTVEQQQPTVSTNAATTTHDEEPYHQEDTTVAVAANAVNNTNVNNNNRHPVKNSIFANNYNTAVMAAKTAIDASNKSRVRSLTNNYSNKSIHETASDPELLVMEENNVNDDPELVMEASPDSSVIEGSNYEATENDNHTMEVSPDRSAVGGFGEMESTAAAAAAPSFAQSNNTTMNNAFGTSYVNSDIDMFANSDDEKENTKSNGVVDPFGSSTFPPSSTFFDTDPFESIMFDGGNKSLVGVNNDNESGGSNIANKQSVDDPMGDFNMLESRGMGENELLTIPSEESVRFDAQFQDDFGITVNDDEKEAPHNGDEPSQNEPIDSSSDDSVEVANEPVPQSRGIEAGSFMSKLQSFDSQYEEEQIISTPTSAGDIDDKDSTRFLADQHGMQQLSTDINDYAQDDENDVESDDEFGTFQMHPLDISFAPPNDLHRISKPTQNPLTGNLIVCRCQDGDFYIDEVGTSQIHSPTILMSARIISSELRTKISRTLGTGRNVKVMGVSAVLSLVAGVHRAHGQDRVRVVALTDLVVMNNGKMDMIRVVAVWKWGYNYGGGDVVSLQSVLRTPGADDETLVYDPKTLQVADGVLFFGGHKLSRNATDPMVFVAKPAVRDGWVSIPIHHYLERTEQYVKLSVSALAAINDKNTSIAVGITDGSICVLNYNRAIRTNRTAENADKDPSLLELVCRMRGVMDLLNLSDRYCLWKDGHDNALESTLTTDPVCQSLSWMQPFSSGFEKLSLLAAACDQGVTVYRVHSTPSNDSSSEYFEPLAKAKYSTTSLSTHSARVKWFDAGPRSPPFLAISVKERKATKLNLCAIDIPWFGSSEILDTNSRPLHRSIGIISQTECNFDTDVHLFTMSQLGAVACYNDGKMSIFQPSLSVQSNTSASNTDKVNGYFCSLCCPVSSQSLGIDTDGSTYSDKSPASVKSQYEDAVLSVFSVNTCGDSSIMQLPSQRHWLLISVPGDKPIGDLVKEDADDDNFNVSYRREAERGGAVPTVLCELTCAENPVSGLKPERITREDGGRRAAVLFTSGYFGSRSRRARALISTDPVAYALLDIDEAMKDRTAASFTLRHARDVAFLPTFKMEGGFYCSSIVVLDPDGSGLSITTVISSQSRDGMTEKVIESEDKCLLHHEGIVGRRVFALLNGEDPQLLLAGHSTVVGRPCLILAQHELERDTYNTFSLIESDALGHRLWLTPGEEVLSARELPRHPNAVRALIAVATQMRVMILQADELSLSIITEVNAHVTCSSLSPIGSHCVAFSASSTPYGVESCIMYLSCLSGQHGHGIIASFPSKQNCQAHVLLTALRPDRAILSLSHAGVIFSNNESDKKIDIPLLVTRPVLLLQPLLANALCQDEACGKNASQSVLVQQLLRLVLEKFGRKETSLPHTDEEGIGCFGAGLTSAAYEMLVQNNCHCAALALLTGSTGKSTEDSAQTKILPPWITISSKLMAAVDSDTRLQVMSNGNVKLNVTMKSFNNVEALAYNTVKDNVDSDALRMLDFVGTISSSDALKQILLSINAQESLSKLDHGEKTGTDLNALLPRLISCLASRDTKKESEIIGSQLALSVQTNAIADLPIGSCMIDKESLEAVVPKSTSLENSNDFIVKEAQHIWSTGPFHQKAKLLSLDAIEDWFGRCLPTLLGNEGVAMAEETGEQTLQHILTAAALDERESTSAPEQENDYNAVKRNNWVEGIGDEHLDEDNLSLYLRFSEGADEDSKWKLDGFFDLSKHGHRCHLHGADYATVEATTSSADEGDEGKVHLLHDLVFDEGAPRDIATGLYCQVTRGGSLDIGMLHLMHNKSRQKCTIEFWYHVPQPHLVADEIILARRSVSFDDAIDESKHLFLPDEKHNTLWELALLPTGLLELRTGAGSVVSSAMAVDVDNKNACNGIVSWGKEDGKGGWNHVCILFSAQSTSSPTEFAASILMNGALVVPSTPMFVNPLDCDLPQSINEHDLEDAMENSVLAFGIGPSVGFRITEIRVWACMRDEEDVRLMMHEYLRNAEMKRKLKVNIRKGPKIKPYSGLLAPLPLAPHAEERRTVNPISPPSQQPQPPSNDAFTDFANFEDENDFNENESQTSIYVNNASNSREPNASHADEDAPADPIADSNVEDQIAVHANEEARSPSPVDPSADPSFFVTLSDLLSSLVRKSASSAIVRGPPAARHFGGNRGGLLSSQRRQGIGPVAICGSDKVRILKITNTVNQTHWPSSLTLTDGPTFAVHCILSQFKLTG
eukprot:scaffold41876_cov59-Cyclotella_meneghiniana.AAC.1